MRVVYTIEITTYVSVLREYILAVKLWPHLPKNNITIISVLLSQRQL